MVLQVSCLIILFVSCFFILLELQMMFIVSIYRKSIAFMRLIMHQHIFSSTFVYIRWSLPSLAFHWGVSSSRSRERFLFSVLSPCPLSHLQAWWGWQSFDSRRSKCYIIFILSDSGEQFTRYQDCCLTLIYTNYDYVCMCLLNWSETAHLRGVTGWIFNYHFL